MEAVNIKFDCSIHNSTFAFAKVREKGAGIRE